VSGRLPKRGDGGLAEDMEAAVSARSELGDDYDAALLRSFVERLDAEIDERLDRRLPSHDRASAFRDAVTVVIALGSIGFGVLFVAAADALGSTGATVATIVAWIAILLINVVHARGRRP